VRIEKERQSRAQRQCRISAVGAGGIGPGSCQQQLLRRDRGKDLAETAELDRNGDYRGEGGET
jgi:hypothetical protein